MAEAEHSETSTATVPPEFAGQRLDVTLARLFPRYSRSLLKRWLEEGNIRIDDRRGRPSDRVGGGERLALSAAPALSERWEAEPGLLAVVHEDEQVIVIDKPAGLVTHPGAGNRAGTLVNLLLHRYPELGDVPRAGLVHRLDKDTTGLLVCARTTAAHTDLVAQLQRREVSRHYSAIVRGVVTGGGTVDAPIGRDPRHRTRMAVTRGGRAAVTHYRVLERFRAHSLLDVRLETGRTHQIRVHLAHVQHPLVGDDTYAAGRRLAAGVGPALRQRLLEFPRQALHARRLGFRHPGTGEEFLAEAPLPADMTELIDLLAADAAQEES